MSRPVRCSRCKIEAPNFLIPTHQFVGNGRFPGHALYLCPDCWASWNAWYTHPGRYVYDAGYVGETP